MNLLPCIICPGKKNNSPGTFHQKVCDDQLEFFFIRSWRHLQILGKMYHKYIPNGCTNELLFRGRLYKYCASMPQTGTPENNIVIIHLCSTIEYDYYDWKTNSVKKAVLHPQWGVHIRYHFLLFLENDTRRSEINSDIIEWHHTVTKESDTRGWNYSDTRGRYKSDPRE